MRKRAWARAFVMSLAGGLAVAGLTGCESVDLFSGNPDEFSVPDDAYAHGDAPIADADIESLWERARQVVSGEGLLVDESRTRYAERLLVTRWNTFLTPQRYEGRRSRVWIHFRKQETGWTPEVAVQVQRNADIDNPGDPQLANWEEQPADSARAGVILWKIESGFRAAGR